MKYRSKKDETIIAHVENENEKYGTVTLVYDTGENAGKTFDVTTATLKRWWSQVDEEKSETEILNLDMEKINEPYPEPKEQKYIPKPQSVIEYEEKKRGRRYNNNIPEFTEIVDKLGSVCEKINENSKYVKLNDGFSTIWRKSSWINVYACTETAEKLVGVGLISFANKDKDRPFGFKIETMEDYEKLVSVILEDEEET